MARRLRPVVAGDLSGPGIVPRIGVGDEGALLRDKHLALRPAPGFGFRRLLDHLLVRLEAKIANRPCLATFTANHAGRLRERVGFRRLVSATGWASGYNLVGFWAHGGVQLPACTIFLAPDSSIANVNVVLMARPSALSG